MTALMMACIGDHTGIAFLLIDKGADVNAKDQNGYTALILVAGMKRKISISIAKLLIDNCADANAKDKNGKTAWMWAIENGNTEVAKIINVEK